MRERTRFLAATELFAGLPEALLREIDAELEAVELPAGAILFRQGDVGDAVYLIVSGTLILKVDGVTLLTRHAGDCVGEFALIDDEPRSADAVAQTHVSLLRWDRERFRDTLAHNARVANGVFRMLTNKLREDIDSRIRLKLDHERWQQDVQRAQEMQASMLPADDPVLPSFDVSGYCHPAARVGGDYYDYLPLHGDRLGLILGDVTGHGFYPGLFVAMAKSCLHTQVRHEYSPRSVMAAMSRTLALSTHRLLMTCCYVFIEPQHARLAYANAGHPYPCLYRADTGSVEHLESLDPLLGVQEDAEGEFRERQLGWRPGDVLVMYSDGVTEARNPHGEMFGHERLEASLREQATRPAADIKARILAAVEAHVGQLPVDDDLTLTVIKALQR